MLHPYAIALMLFTAVLGERGRNDQTFGPLQVAGVAAGTGILLVGGGALVAYGIYANWGRHHAVTEALGDIPRRVKAVVSPETPAQEPASAPASQPAETQPADALPADALPAAESATGAAPDTAPAPAEGTPPEAAQPAP